MRPICAQKSLGLEEQGMVMGNGDGSGWCGSTFSKFLTLLSCCISSGFIDFCSTFDNFTPLASVLHQTFQAIRADTERFHGDLLCVLGVLALRQFTIEQFLWKAVIFHADNMTCPRKLWLSQDGVDARCQGCVFAIWCRDSSSDRLCESGLVSLYAVDKLSMFHNYKGGQVKMIAQYTLILVASKMPLWFHTFLLSQLMAALICVNLVFTSLPMREGAAKVGELLNHLQSLYLDGDVGLNIWFSRCWLVHHFYLFCADG